MKGVSEVVQHSKLLWCYDCPYARFLLIFCINDIFLCAFALVIILNMVKYADSYQVLCFSKGETANRKNK